MKCLYRLKGQKGLAEDAVCVVMGDPFRVGGVEIS